MNKLIKRPFGLDLGAIIILVLLLIIMVILKQWEHALTAGYAAVMISWINYEQLVMVWRKVRAARRRKGLPS